MQEKLWQMISFSEPGKSWMRYAVLLHFGAIFLLFGDGNEIENESEPSARKVTSLPSPAGRPVDFELDVRPILMDSCYRCHGPKRSKSGFRLDVPSAAMEGGDLGVAIIPGSSASSPLIHYVAGLEADMEMPPVDSGDPLTPEQIGILRAWIDQGASWEGLGDVEDFTPEQVWSFSPMTRWIEVQGASRLFEEHTGMRSGWTAGVERFTYQTKISPTETFTAKGRLLSGQEDYLLDLDYQNDEKGYVRAGWNSYREFDNPNGGYYAGFGTPALSLNRDLILGYQKLWVELGWTPNPDALVELAYDFQVRDGEKSLLQWGLVSDPNFALGDRAIYPAFKGLREERHNIRISLRRQIEELRIADDFNIGFTKYKAGRNTIDFYPFFGNRYQEEQDSWNISNAIQMNRRFRDWLMVSGGYMFNNWRANGAFTQLGFDPSQPTTPLFLNDVADPIQIRRDTHLFNVGALLGPWEDFSVSMGIQNEWTQQKGSGTGLGFGFAPLTYNSNLDKLGLEEEITFRYKGIPKTTLYWENRFQQESIDQYESSFQDDSFGSSRDFMRDTEAFNETYISRIGTSFTPWRKVSMALNYGPKLRRNRFDHDLDQSGDLFSGNGYPAFIKFRETLSQVANARISVRWNSTLRSSLQYQWQNTKYQTEVASRVNLDDGSIINGSSIESGSYHSDNVFLNTVWTPKAWINFNLGLNHGWTELLSGVNGIGAIVPYRGKTYGGNSGAAFQLPWESSLNLNYIYSKSDYGQNNATTGLPLGVEFQRHGLLTGLSKKFREGLSGSLQYGYFEYDEPTMGGANDYTAHSVFLVMDVMFQ